MELQRRRDSDLVVGLLLCLLSTSFRSFCTIKACTKMVRCCCSYLVSLSIKYYRVHCCCCSSFKDVIHLSRPINRHIVSRSAVVVVGLLRTYCSGKQPVRQLGHDRRHSLIVINSMNGLHCKSGTQPPAHHQLWWKLIDKYTIQINAWATAKLPLLSILFSHQLYSYAVSKQQYSFLRSSYLQCEVHR